MGRAVHRRLHARLPLLMRALAALMLMVAVPGAQELIEDLIHFVADGHTAHDAGHTDEQPGHCCSGLFHVCACHANTVATPAHVHVLLDAHASALAVRHDLAEVQLKGFHAPPFRPPASQI